MIKKKEKTLPYVSEWWKPPANQERPIQIYKNLSCSIEGNRPCLNASEDERFNSYTSGYGGICDLWEGESYWCGNYSAGNFPASFLLFLFSLSFFEGLWETGRKAKGKKMLVVFVLACEGFEPPAPDVSRQ